MSKFGQSELATTQSKFGPSEIFRPAEQQDPSLLQRAIGGAEALGSIVAGAVAEPIAGLTGIGAAIIPGGKTGGEQVEATREAFAETFQPRTEAGQQAIQTVGEVVAPIGEAFGAAEQFLGDKTFELTGSPTLAAFATALPTAGAELIGLAGTRGAISRGRETAITREIAEAAPTPQALKNTSRAVFREIDEMGVSVNPESYLDLVIDIERELTKGGIDPDITPAASKALTRLEQAVGNEISLSDLDNLRTIAQNAANSMNRPDARLGNMIIGSIDEFLDEARPADFSGDAADIARISDRYSAARDLWGRARRSETLSQAMNKARNQASGFENGIRTQFRAILNSKNKSQFFNESELAAIRQVVEGTKEANLAKLLGRFGFTEGGATNIVGGALGVAGGSAAFGTAGAVLVPVLGQVSRKFAQRLTEGNARFADEVIRAGKNGRQITNAYIRNTPVDQRTPIELAELLRRNDINLGELPDTNLAREAARIARDRRRALLAAAGAGALTPRENNQQQ